MSGASSSGRDLGAPPPGDIGHVSTLDVAGPASPAARPVTPDRSPEPAVISPGRSPGGMGVETALLRPGESLGRFVVRAELGRGGMGVVYAADDATLGREVALKVLRISDEEEPRRRFLREARSAAALTDHGIATVYDVGEDAGRVFIAMELVRGQTLRALLEARPADDRALPVAEARAIAAAVARALGAAHARGVIHRDLKPENVMMADSGLVKILDFGLAKRFDPTLSTITTASTEDGRIMGTPSYMSPEQTKGRAVDARSDVFSLGVMLYEMVTGRRPFDRPSVVEMFVAIDRDEPPPPSRQNPRVPAALERVILRCLRKDPAARPADGRALLAELSALDVPAPPRSPRAAFGVAAAVACVGIAAFAASRAAPSAPLPALAATSASASVATRSTAPTPVTALPLPAAGLPEAIAAYRQGIASFRDGEDWSGGFSRAVELDPTLAAAHLRLAAIAMAEAVPSAREHYRKADELRASLTERDRAMLDAIEPVVRRQPADWAEANRRFAALVERYPGDAELWFFLGSGTANFADFEVGARHYARAVAIDPGFSRAWAGMAMDQAYLGRFDEARRTVEQCLAVSPSAFSCLSHLGLLQGNAGDCEGMEATARRAVASGAQPAAAYQHLAQALAARGQSISTVREALSQSEQAFAAAPGVTAEEREKHALGRGVMLSLLAGDFEAAEKGARAYEKLVAASRRQDDHGRVALVLGAVLEEQGRDKEAAGVALDFLDRRDAWEPNPGAEDIAMARDATPSLLVTALRGGRLTRAAYASRRAAWLKGWTARLTPVSKNFLWLHGWARAVDDAEGAREALAALPGYQPLPPFRPLTPVDLDVGRTFLLAGQAEQAIPWLAGFTRTCGVLEHPVEHLRAHLWLGRAREAQGDAQGACAAYRVVVDRWGQARPRSVTAEAAAARLLALRCAGPGSRRQAGAPPRPGGDDDDDEGPPEPPPPPP